MRAITLALASAVAAAMAEASAAKMVRMKPSL